MKGLKRVFCFSLVVFTCFSGCTMVPEYTRPAAPVPTAWPSGPAYSDSAPAQHAAAADDLQWREFFKDKRLQQVIEAALENNRDLRVAALNVERARALYRIQRAELLPKLDATAAGLKERVPGEISGSGGGNAEGAVTFEQYSAELGITSWELDFFGRIRSLEESALEEYFATEFARRSAQILLISEVAAAYMTLAADRENLELAQSTLESQQASYNLIRRRFEVGIAPDLDVRQVQQRVEAARVDVALYTRLVAQDENALNLLVGAPVPAELLPKELRDVKALPNVSPGISSEVLLSRPDVLQAESRLKAANANIGAARAALFPRISLTTAVGTASGDLTGLFQSGSLAWNFAPKMVMPIFDPRLWSAVTVTKVDREIAQAQYEAAIQSAFRDVADALATMGTVGAQLEAQRSLVDASAASYRLAYARYDKGIDTFLSALDAQRSLYGAQQGFIAIHLAKIINRLRLYAALGGGAQ